MAPLLLGEPLLQLLHALVPAAERLDALFLLLAQVELADRFEPFLGDLGLDGRTHQVETLEDVSKHPVEPVEVALVLHQHRPGEIVEVLDIGIDDARVERFQQGQIFLQGDRHLVGSKLLQEAGQHGESRFSLLVVAARQSNAWAPASQCGSFDDRWRRRRPEHGSPPRISASRSRYGNSRSSRRFRESGRLASRTCPAQSTSWLRSRAQSGP